MRVAILTFHFARNYGAVLQCYALVQHLTAAGHDVSVIDYRPGVLARGYKVFDLHRFWGKTPSKFFKKTIREFKVLKKRRLRYKAFEAFLQDNFKFAPANDLSCYDLILVGSDQVWNAELTRGYDKHYWGPFKSDARVASYAASFGSLANIDKEKAISLLQKNFDIISLREKSAVTALRKVNGARADIDPVFLPDVSVWNALAEKSTLSIGKPYLLLYLVKPSAEAVFFARGKAESKGLKLVILSAKLEMDNSSKVATASPADFVRLFCDAEYVVTTSFHGTAFSIIFGKEFQSFNASGDNRITDLLAAENSLDQQKAESIQYLAEITR